VLLKFCFINLNEEIKQNSPGEKLQTVHWIRAEAYCYHTE